MEFRSYDRGTPKWTALNQEVDALLSKGAIERVDCPSAGYYSRPFVVPKATGGWRPIIDLSQLNVFVQQTQFKMETVSSVRQAIKEGDFMASIDLRDAYLHVPVHPEHWKYLRFVW